MKNLNLIVELIEFYLLPLDFLVVINQLFLAVFFFLLKLTELSLTIEKIVLALAKILLGDPALSLLVTLLTNKFFQLSLFASQLLL